MDMRSQDELRAIKVFCTVSGIDPEPYLQDATCRLEECARRIRVLRSVRAAMGTIEIYRNREVIEHGHRRARH